MSPIATKYGMTDEEYKKAINDRLISTTWLRKEEIFIHYKAKLQNAKNKTEAVAQTATDYKCEPSYIYQVIGEPVFK